MRRLIWTCLVGLTIWCLWWAVASAFLRGGIENWTAARTAEGWQAEVQKIEGGGFPDTLVANLVKPEFSDPQTGVTFHSSSLRFEAKAYWPGFAQVVLPQDAIQVSTPDGRFDIVMSDGFLNMDLHPGTKLQVQHLAWTSGPWGVTSGPGSLVSADSLNLSMTQGDTKDTYSFDVSAQSLRPGEIPRSNWAIPDHWPIAFDTFELDMDVRFDRPWDLRSLEERRPQPRRIELHLAEAAWGDVQINVAAELDIDDAGTASGDLSLQARNWRDVLILAETSGLLPSGVREQAERALGQFAALSGNPNTIDVKLTFKNGLMFLGFIPLGSAPQIVLH
ncbi:MAG: DUF2125 domain-containing protein [Paracoccaceae bacterium]